MSEPMAISNTPLSPTRHLDNTEPDEADDGWGDPPQQATTEDKTPAAAAATNDNAATNTDTSTVSSTSASASTSASTSQSFTASESSSPTPPPTTHSNTNTNTNTTSMPPPPINPAVLRISQLRLQSDLKALETDPPDGISANPLDPDNLYLWRACIFGPEDTPWEGGVFQLRITFPKEYPQKPPTVRFTSKMFHPNVFADGTLCLDIIQDQWSPIYTVSMILTSIQSLLTDPNPASPANPEAAKLLHDDPKEYRKRVRACAAKATM